MLKLYIDIHPNLASVAPPDSIRCDDSINKIDSAETAISIPSYSCNDLDYTSFNVSRFIALETLEIGDHCFGSVVSFDINNMNTLKTISIGSNAFTHNPDSFGSYSSKSFRIENCELLESIIIKERSFSDYAGQFILRGLSSLTSLVIGISSDLSYNFASSNVEIAGNLFYFTTSV